MAYHFNIKNKKLMHHGSEIFDKQYFGHFFRKYDMEEIMFYGRFYKAWIRFIDKYLPPKNEEEKKALEIGCGIGAFGKLLKERGFNLTATDISSFIINKAKRNLKNIKFEVLDIEKEIKIKNKYDYVFAFEVIEHLHNPIHALKNMKGFLKREGILIFSTPYPTKETLSDPMHINVSVPEYWLSAGKKLGFKTIEVKYASFIPFLYRFHSFFSRAVPFRIDSHYVNSTCFYIFKK